MTPGRPLIACVLPRLLCRHRLRSLQRCPWRSLQSKMPAAAPDRGSPKEASSGWRWNVNSRCCVSGTAPPPCGTLGVQAPTPPGPPDTGTQLSPRPPGKPWGKGRQHRGRMEIAGGRRDGLRVRGWALIWWGAPALGSAHRRKAAPSRPHPTTQEISGRAFLAVAAATTARSPGPAAHRSLAQRGLAGPAS